MWHMKDNIKSKPQGVSQIARFRAKYVIFGVHKYVTSMREYRVFALKKV